MVMAKKNARKLLFVCTANQCRSKAFDKVLNGFERAECKSAGTRGGARLTQKLVDWADRIVVMELRHWEWLEENFPDALEKTEIAGIKDIYYAGHPELDRLAEKWAKGKGLEERREHILKEKKGVKK
ncbi:MAG: protein tyrosine phosphatase [Candidatus Micrarchaeota archaeon]|nr:protein tyrosine phosphatase [Candidatus Micrarchaeota archaeon]